MKTTLSIFILMALCAWTTPSFSQDSVGSLQNLARGARGYITPQSGNNHYARDQQERVGIKLFDMSDLGDAAEILSDLGYTKFEVTLHKEECILHFPGNSDLSSIEQALDDERIEVEQTNDGMMQPDPSRSKSQMSNEYQRHRQSGQPARGYNQNSRTVDALQEQFLDWVNRSKTHHSDTNEDKM